VKYTETLVEYVKRRVAGETARERIPPRGATREGEARGVSWDDEFELYAVLHALQIHA